MSFFIQIQIIRLDPYKIPSPAMQVQRTYLLLTTKMLSRFRELCLAYHGQIMSIQPNLSWPTIFSQEAPELVARTPPAARHVHFSYVAVRNATNDGHSQSDASRGHNIDTALRQPQTSLPAHEPYSISLFPSRERDLATRPPPPLPISQAPYLANTARLIQHQRHIHQDQAAPNQRQSDSFQRDHRHGASSNDQNLNLHEEVTGEKWPQCHECEAKPFVYKYHGMQYCKACFGELCARVMKFEKHKKSQVLDRRCRSGIGRP